MIWGRLAVVVALLLCLGVVLLMRSERRKRVIVIEPIWQCAEVTGLGDAGCDWKPLPRSARIRDIEEARGF